MPAAESAWRTYGLSGRGPALRLEPGEGGRTARLAEAGALACFRRSRRQALWDARAARKPDGPSFEIELREPDMAVAPLSLLEEVAWDYDASSHSTRAPRAGDMW